VTETALAAPASPYKGLAAFADSELDALLFFGREREIEVIAANLIAAQLTVLYGPSGVGKTSLLRAGVAHKLRREGTAVAVVSSWSGDPVGGLLSAVEREVRRVAHDVDRPPPGSLAEILSGWTRRLGADLYLILDQFEEYFLYHGDEAGAGPLTALADAIREPGTRAHVVLSVREDALAQLDAFKSQLPGLFGNSLRLDRLDRRAAARAIRGPLERYNELVPADDAVEVEDELVDDILDSVEAGRIRLGDAGLGGAEEKLTERGRIEAPYLQLVLERLWEVEAERGSKRLRVETLRGLGGASRIVEDHLERAMAALSPAEKDAAAAMYNYLVTPSGTKIAHRAGDLARYAAVDEGEAQRVLKRLAGERIVRAGENGAAGMQYEIFHDVLADAVLAWRSRHEAERRLEQERRDAARRHRRLLAVAAAALAAVVVLAGISIYALTLRSEAQQNAREARAGELVALAAASLANDPQRSLTLALDASRTIRSSAIEDMLRESLGELRLQAVTRIRPGEEAAALSRDGRLLATTRGDEVRLYGGSGTRLLRTLRHARATTAEFSRDGRLVATGGDDGMVRVWNTRTGHLAQTIVHPGPVESVAFAPNGRELLSFGPHRVVYIWELRDAFLRLKLRLRGFVGAARFAPKGEVVGTGGSDKVGRLWDVHPRTSVLEGVVPTGRVIQQLKGHLGRVGAVAFGPRGGLVATGSTDGTARVWKVADGELVTILPGHENFVTGVEFRPDGKLIATASRDRRARVFDAFSPTLRATLAGHTEPVTDLAWSRDGTKLVTASTDGTVRTWDALPLPRLRFLRRHGRPVASVAFRANRIESSTVAREDPRLAARPKLLGAIDSAGHRTAISLSADKRLAVAGYADGVVRLWNARTATPVRELPPHRARVTSATFSRDGRLVVTTGADHDARVSNVASGRQLWVLSHPALVSDADFSSDGRWVAIAGPGEAGIVDATTGERILLLDGQDRLLTSIAFSPTGWRIATGGSSGAVRTYNCRICGGTDELIQLAEERLAQLRPKTS
jgi:WD40 repeat protein